MTVHTLRHLSCNAWLATKFYLKNTDNKGSLSGLMLSISDIDIYMRKNGPFISRRLNHGKFFLTLQADKKDVKAAKQSFSSQE